MADTFFTADTHFFHKAILKYTERNKHWSSLEEMNEALLERWNAKVSKKDHVYHLGDVIWRPNDNAKFLNRLNGNITLISGNHDDNQTKRLNRFKDVYDFREIKLDNTHLSLFHYKMATWNKARYGALHLYGHSHGTLEGSNQCCDVGVDNPAWNYAPVNLEEIKDFLKNSNMRE